MLNLIIEENAEKRKRQIETLKEMIKIDKKNNDIKSLDIHTKAFEALTSKDCPKKGQICLEVKKPQTCHPLTEMGEQKND